MRCVYSKLILSLFLLVSPSVFSEELTEMDFLAEQPIQISSVTRLNQTRQNIPASITIIDREMIEASSAINVIELLRLVPGFLVSSIDGTESTTTYHGLSSQHNERLQIIIDGRSVYQSTFGGALWYSLPITLDEIEKIEVIRGPNAASYGANSFSGTINITTMKSDAGNKNEFSILAGDRDTQRATFSHADGNEDLSYRVIAQFEENTGYQDTYQDFEKDGKAKPLNDDHFHRQLSFRIDKNGSDGALHTFQAGMKDLKFGGGWFNYEDLAPFDKKVTSHFQNYTYLKSDGLFKTRRFQIYHNYIDYNATLFNAPSNPLELVTLDWSFRDQRIDMEFQENQIWSPELQTVWGLGYRYELSDSIGWLAEDHHSRNSYRIFGHLEYNLTESLILNAGGFAEDHEDIGNYISPRLALNYRINNQHTLRTSLSRAYRMPSFYAQYADQTIESVVFPGIGYPQTLGDNSLDPEEMTSFEIGYFGQFFNDKLELDIRLAHEKIEQIIDRTKTERNIYRSDPFNIYRFNFISYGQVDLESAEVQLNYKPSKKTFLNFYISLTDTDGYRADSLDLNKQPFKIEYLDDHVPYKTIGALISHKPLPDLRLSMQYNYVDAYTSEGDGSNLDRFESLDLKFTKEISTEKGEKLEFSGIVRNVSDNPYQDFENDNFVGLETYFQVKLSLN